MIICLSENSCVTRRTNDLRIATKFARVMLQFWNGAGRAERIGGSGWTEGCMLGGADGLDFFLYFFDHFYLPCRKNLVRAGWHSGKRSGSWLYLRGFTAAASFAHPPLSCPSSVPYDKPAGQHHLL